MNSSGGPSAAPATAQLPSQAPLPPRPGSVPVSVERMRSEANAEVLRPVPSCSSVADSVATQDAMAPYSPAPPSTLPAASAGQLESEESTERRLQRLPRFIPPVFEGPLPVPESPEDSRAPTPDPVSPRSARVSYVYVEASSRKEGRESYVVEAHESDCTAVRTQEVPPVTSAPEPEKEEDCITARASAAETPEAAKVIAAFPCIVDEGCEDSSEDDGESKAEPEEEHDHNEPEGEDLPETSREALAAFIQQTGLGARPAGEPVWQPPEEEVATSRVPILGQELWLRLDELEPVGEAVAGVTPGFLQQSVPPSTFTYRYSTSSASGASGSDSSSDAGAGPAPPAAGGWGISLGVEDASGGRSEGGDDGCESGTSTPVSLEACSPLRRAPAPDPTAVPPPLLLGRIGVCMAARPVPAALGSEVDQWEPEAAPPTPLQLENAPEHSPTKSVRLVWASELPHMQSWSPDKGEVQRRFRWSGGVGQEAKVDGMS